MSNRYESGSPATCSGEEVTARKTTILSTSPRNNNAAPIILFCSGLCFHVRTTYLFYSNFLDSGSSINRGSSGDGCYRFKAFKTRP